MWYHGNVGQNPAMKLTSNNYAFIDGQNLNLGTLAQGWKLDWKEFRRHLTEQYHVTKAVYCIGYIQENQNIYKMLERCGFHLVYKPTVPDGHGNHKGNCDADLVLWAMREFMQYQKAVIVSSDGDYHGLVEFLREQGKLRAVVSVKKEKCSSLLKVSAGTFMSYLSDVRGKMEFTPQIQRGIRATPLSVEGTPCRQNSRV